jgi:hypothetical protein
MPEHEPNPGEAEVRGGSLLARLAAVFGRIAVASCHLVFYASVAGVLNGATCVVGVADCDDDDDFDDDDECVDDDDDFSTGEAIAESAPSGNPYRLRSYRLVEATAPWHHPVAAVEEIEGLSVLSVRGPGVYDLEALCDFAAEVYCANPDLLGLPPEAGWIRYRDVGVEGTSCSCITVVTYEQIRCDSEEGIVPVEGATVRFSFNASGKLLRIENDTLLSFDGVPASAGK